MTNKPRSEETRLRNLKRALGEADRLAETLDIPRDVRSDGTALYRQIRREGKLPGRSVEEVIAATLYLACRDHEVPRTPDDFAAHSDYDRTTILRAASFVEEVMNLNIPPARPQMYVDRICDTLGLELETREKAKNMIDTAEDAGVLSGISPTGAAAGAVYAAGQITGEKPTQSRISSVADASEVTIRNRYQDILESRSVTNPDNDGKN